MILWHSGSVVVFRRGGPQFDSCRGFFFCSFKIFFCILEWLRLGEAVFSWYDGRSRLLLIRRHTLGEDGFCRLLRLLVFFGYAGTEEGPSPPIFSSAGAVEACRKWNQNRSTALFSNISNWFNFIALYF